MAHPSYIKIAKNGWLEKSLLIFILLTATFLRLYKIADYLTFLGDEGRDVLVVYGILHGDLTLLGPTASVGGFFLGPIYYYFMAPFLWLSNYNPVGPAVMVALFGIATVGLVYKVGSEFFGKKAGFFAASLYTVSPLVIAYSRSSWNPNPMPFFSLLMLYLLYRASKNNSWKLLVIAGIFFGIMMQLHYLATFLGVIIVVYLLAVKLFDRKKIDRSLGIIKNYFYILIGFLIGFSPFLIFEVRHGFPNIISIFNFIFSSKDTGSNPHFYSTIWSVFFRLFGRLITMFPPPEQVSINSSIIPIDFYFFSFKTNVFYLYYLTITLAIASLSVLIYKFLKNLRNKEVFNKLSLLIIWLFLGVFLFGFYKKAIYDYYLGFMFPLPFLLVGNLLSSVYSKRFGKVLSISIFTILMLLNLAGMPFRSSPNQQLTQVEEISRFVFDQTNGKPFNFALITQGNSDHAYRYFFKLWGRDPIVIQNSQIDPERKSVTDQLLIICEDLRCKPLGDPLWEVAGFGRAEIAGEWPVSVLKVYKLVHYKGK